MCLSSIKLPESVFSIGAMAFSNCRSLCELIIPSSVISIGEEAFSGCHSLHELTIPSSVTSIGGSAFNDCPSLLLNIQNPKFRLIENSIVVDTNKGVVLSCLNNKNNIIIPPFVTSIGDEAFSNCGSLYELVIPSSVTSIGSFAFMMCHSLHQIIIPSSIKSIGSSIFIGCSSLKSIVVPNGQTAKFRELLKNAGCNLSIIKERDE